MKKLLAAYMGGAGLAMLNAADIERLDILYLSFGYVRDGQISLQTLGDLSRLDDLRRKKPELIRILSLNGGPEQGFSFVCKTEERMDAFVQQAAELMVKYDLDGIDVDWEYPTVNGNASERHQHTVLLKKLREALDSISQDKAHYLTIAAGSKSWYFTITELEDSIRYLDYVNLMTYDVNAASTRTVHHACPCPISDEWPEGSTQENIEVFHKLGVPLDKLIVGAAFYSRKWEHVPNDNRGLLVEAGTQSDYGPIYTELAADYIDKNGFVRYWDDTAKAPYLFNGDTFITYDDEQSLHCKCELVNEYDIAGIMIWNYEYDKNHVLLAGMRAALDQSPAALMKG